MNGCPAAATQETKRLVEHLETLEAISLESGSAEKVSVAVCPDCRTSRSSGEEKGKRGRRGHL